MSECRKIDILNFQPALVKPAITLFLILLLAITACTQKRVQDNSFRRRGSDASDEITMDDVKAEVEFGKILAAKILGKYNLYKDEKLTNYVSLVGKGLARYSGRPELEFHFAILDTDSVNAYAAPGGFIFITRGAIKNMTNEADLAGVLAHEIAHVTEKHVVKELKIQGKDKSSTSTMTSLIKTFSGGGGFEVAFLEMAERAAELLFETGLKHEDEFDADRVGALILAQVGYHTPALQEYLEIIKVIKDNDKLMNVYNKTHPTFDDRISRLVAHAKENRFDELKGKKLEDRFLKSTEKE